MIDYKFKLVRRVHYLLDTGKEGVCLDILARTPLGECRLEIPASSFRGLQALDAITDRTGFVFPDTARARDKLHAASQKPSPLVFKTSTTGWRSVGSKSVFVTTNKVLGDQTATGSYEYLDNPMIDPSHVASAGTARGWRRTVGKHLLKSSIGITLAGAALAAPLIKFTALREMFTIVLAGETSTGKSSIQDGAFSVQGQPSELSADSSKRAILERGAAYNHMLFAVADLALLPPKDAWSLVNHLAYGVTASASRTTSRINARSLPALNFQNIAVCTSEKTASIIAGHAGADRQGGESVRLFDITCTQPPGFFDRIDEEDEPSEIADALREATRRHFGVILPDWIDWICDQDEDQLRADLEVHIDRFVRWAMLSGRQKQREQRAARKFGLLYGALILAIRAKVLTWTRADARAAVSRSYEVAMMNAPIETAEEAVIELQRILKAPAAICEEEMAGDDPNWLGVRTRAGNRPVIGLRESAIIDVLGKYKAKLAFAALERDGVLKMGHGQARWQKRVSGTKYRLLQLEMRALEA